MKQLSAKQFSIVLETENLACADVQGLVTALTSLAAQTPHPSLANEVLLIDSGDTPPELLAHLCTVYPWLSIKAAPPGTQYYQAKMLGAHWCTGEILVYYDCDCVYESTWLQSLLASFDDDRVQVVGGETTTSGVGVYGTAMALAYIFPQYSGDRSLQPTTQYFLNNVAFVRSFLLANPIPDNLPLYRGNCVIHAQTLLASGHIIWRQPQARALHAPPYGWRHFYWRFLLIGHDLYWQKKLLCDRYVHRSLEHPIKSVSDDPTIGQKSKLQIFFDRVSKMIQRDRRHAIFLPLCLPIVLSAATLIYVGYQTTLRRPHYLRDRCQAYL